MSQTQQRTVARVALLLLGLSLFGAGCGTTKPGKPVPWTVKFTKKTAASVEVDVIAISSTEDDYWRRGVKPGDYWNPGKAIRKENQERSWRTAFEQGPTATLAKEDEKWKQSAKYGASELLIMANLPGNFSNDEFDPRRKIISLGKNAWNAKDTIEVEIGDSQIRVITPPAQ